MIINNFYKDVLADHERGIETVFDPPTGAVFEPERDDGTPGFLYTESTAYAILDLILLYNITGNIKYLEKANKSAHWIQHQAQDSCGGVLARYYFIDDTSEELLDTSFFGRNIFSFDTATCIKALCNLYRLSKEETHLKLAEKMALFLINNMIESDGTIHAIFNAKKRVFKENPNIWSRQFGAFHAKVAEGLIELYRFVNDDRYLKIAESICNRVLTFQLENGNFITSPAVTELHPHCYAAEGLLFIGQKTNNHRFIDASFAAIKWALDQTIDGEIPQSFDCKTMAPLSGFRTDALAQVLAIGSDFLRHGYLGQEYIGKLNLIANKILSLKSSGDGLFNYGCYEKEINGKRESKTKSSWTNFFCFQALYKYYLSLLLEKTHVIILAGGKGSRCWPIACISNPKPLTKAFLGNRSLLEETIRRYTNNFIIRPEKISIICSEYALSEARKQAAKEGIPQNNFIIEKSPQGTIPATSLAINTFPQKDEKIFIVSMADNVIEPYDNFHAALISALFVANEEQCIVSVGKPIHLKKERDSRFGHILFNHAINSYRAYKVDRFIEKPDNYVIDDLLRIKSNVAWECGTIIFKGGYYDKISVKDGNLGDHLLNISRPWSEDGNTEGLRMAVSLLAKGTRFEDFGVPGENIKRFFKNSNFDYGNNNICISNVSNITLVNCSENLIISDNLSVEVHELHNLTILDNAVTNSTIIMPLTEIHNLPKFYRLFSRSLKYNIFTTGCRNSSKLPLSLVVKKSRPAIVDSNNGLILIFKCEQSLYIKKDSHSLFISKI